MPVEIIEGMPMPQMKRRGAPPKYPWLQLKPGAAFKFAEGVTFAGARSMASQMTAPAKAKFAVRETASGIYCWRIDGTPYEVQNGNYAQTISQIENYQAEPATQTIVMGHQAATREYLPENASPTIDQIIDALI